MKKAIVLTLALIMAVSAIVLADAGNTLRAGVGARALAMGGAFVSVADDLTASYWNPAGISRVQDTRIGGMSTNLGGIGGITHQYAAGITDISGFGVGLSYDRYSLKYEAKDTTTTSTYAVFIGSVSANIGEMGSVGANAKYVTFPAGKSGFGLDLGAIFDFSDIFTLGVVAFDLLGTQIGEGEALAARYAAGLSMKLADDKLILATDVDFAGFKLGDAHVGVEFKVIDELALRGGLVMTDNFQDYYFTVGAGVNVAGLYVDAAYVINEPVGNTLVLSAEFSLGGLLGGGEEEPAPAPVGEE